MSAPSSISAPPSRVEGPGHEDPDRLTFAEFEISPARRTLRRDGQDLRLGSRSFDLLVALCRRAGEVLSVQDLMAAAWPNRVVDEGGVRVQIAALRKALGDGQGARRFITNVPLRGYCFVAPVVRAGGGAVEVTPHPPALPLPLPLPLPPPTSAWLRSPLIGRDADVDQLSHRLLQAACVTVVGPGGIGKTSLARCVAERLQQQGVEVVFVELARLAHAAHIPTAVASALGIQASDADPLPAVMRALRRQTSSLLVLDNCEHVVEGVAAMVEQVLAHAPQVRVLCTSRESLRVDGEWVQALGPLALPPQTLSDPEALHEYPAAALFTERAKSGGLALRIGSVEAQQVASICRSVDGIPLAIELAAAAVGVVGLEGLVDRLGSRLALLARGRRTAPPRQQTLRATLDWSYQLLSPPEQALLAALSVFQGRFPYAAAQAVSPCPLEELDSAMAGLVGKSLLVADRADRAVHYRLLETTREYAAERLTASDAAREVATRHALLMRHLLQTSGAEDDIGPSGSDRWAVEQAGWIDDVRQAIHWSLTQEAAQSLGVSLVARAAPLYFSLSLLAEYRTLAERAMALIEAADGGDLSNAEEDMHLYEGLGHALWHTQGDAAAMARAFRRALVIAEQRQAFACRRRCLWGLWLVCNATGDYAGSRALAERFGEAAATVSDPVVRLTHARMMALGLHLDGDQDQALEYAKRILQAPGAPTRVTGTGWFQFDQRVAGLAVSARIQWLRGGPDAALAAAAEAVSEAVAIDHALSLCYAIAISAAPVAFWTGDIEQARIWVGMLRQHSDARSLHFWRAFADHYQELLDLEDRRKLPGETPLSASVDTLLRETLCTVQPALADDLVLSRARRGESGWCNAELLRLQGERHWAAGDLDAGRAAVTRGLELARRQGALSWELRACVSLVRWSRTPQEDRAHRDQLGAVLARFREGFGTRDLRLAANMLEGSDAASSRTRNFNA